MKDFQANPRRSPTLKAFVPRRTLSGPRPRSMGTHRMSKAAREEMERDIAALARAGVDGRRPRTVAECPSGPCPFVSCRHHLKLDVDPVTHSVKDNFPGLDVDEMPATCSLRVAARVPQGQKQPLDAVGRFLNICMERARQIEKDALAAVRRRINPRPPLPRSEP